MASSPVSVRHLSIVSLVLVLLVNSITSQNADAYSNTIRQFTRILQTQNLNNEFEEFIEPFVSNLASGKLNDFFQSPKFQGELHQLTRSMNSANFTNGTNVTSGNYSQHQQTSNGQTFLQMAEKDILQEILQLGLLPQFYKILGPLYPQLMSSAKDPSKLLALLPQLLGKLPQLLPLLQQIFENLPESLVSEIQKQIPPQFQAYLPGLFGNDSKNGTVNTPNILSSLPDFAKLFGSMSLNSTKYPISNSCAIELGLLRNGLVSQKEWALRSK